MAAWRFVIVACLLAACATPRPAADIPSGAFPGTTETAQQRTGAPYVAPTLATQGGALTPRPSGGIGQPASYCKPGYCETPEPVPLHLSRPGATAVVGTATYYCRPGISRCTRGYPFGMYAAAGPELRAMLGDWRGRTVVVIDANGRGVLVQLIDWCACGGDHVIDLYWAAYQGLVNPVTVKEEP